MVIIKRNEPVNVVSYKLFQPLVFLHFGPKKEVDEVLLEEIQISPRKHIWVGHSSSVGEIKGIWDILRFCHVLHFHGKSVVQAYSHKFEFSRKLVWVYWDWGLKYY